MAENDKNEGIHHQKIFCVITVARQIAGEYVAIKTEKAFSQASQADALLKELKATYVTPEGKIRPIKVSTPQGDLECFCEVGAFELEIVE